MDSRTFGASTRADGQLQLDDRPTFVARIKSLPPGSRLTITVEEWKGTRSAQANRRYWGRIVRTLQEKWTRERGVQYSKEQVHYSLKAGFLGCVELNGVLVPKDSHDLPPGEFSEYCDSIEGHFAAEGVEFPDEY